MFIDGMFDVFDHKFIVDKTVLLCIGFPNFGSANYKLHVSKPFTIVRVFINPVNNYSHHKNCLNEEEPEMEYKFKVDEEFREYLEMLIDVYAGFKTLLDLGIDIKAQANAWMEEFFEIVAQKYTDLYERGKNYE